MNKIDELKRDIEFHKRGMEISKSLLANAEKDLAALEAQERKPREFEMYLSHNGKLYNSYKETPAGKSSRINVSEVKPIVVTQKVANSMYEYLICRIASNHPTYMTGMLKAAGLDAVASDE